MIVMTRQMFFMTISVTVPKDQLKQFLGDLAKFAANPSEKIEKIREGAKKFLSIICEARIYTNRQKNKVLEDYELYQNVLRLAPQLRMNRQKEYTEKAPKNEKFIEIFKAHAEKTAELLTRIKNSLSDIVYDYDINGQEMFDTIRELLLKDYEEWQEHSNNFQEKFNEFNK